MLEMQAAEAACGGNIQENARACKPFFYSNAIFFSQTLKNAPFCKVQSGAFKGMRATRVSIYK